MDESLTKLADSMSKIVYEMRELETLIIAVRSDIRSHDDGVINFYKQNAELTAEVSISNAKDRELDRLLNELILKESMLCLHFKELIEIGNNIDNKDKEWNRTQISNYQKLQADSLKALQDTQADALEKYQSANRAMIWRMLAIVLAFAVAIAGLTGQIHV